MPRVQGRGILLFERPVTRELVAQPLIARHHRAAIAPYLIGSTAETAFGGGPVNEIFGGGDQISCRQVFVLVAQMRLRRSRVVPGAVAIKGTSGPLNIPKQKIDFHLHIYRGLRTRNGNRQESRQQHQAERQSQSHSSLSTGSSDKIFALMRCQSFLAGSTSYSTALPSSWVRHTKSAAPFAGSGRNANM